MVNGKWKMTCAVLLKEKNKIIAVLYAKNVYSFFHSHIFPYLCNVPRRQNCFFSVDYQYAIGDSPAL